MKMSQLLRPGKSCCLLILFLSLIKITFGLLTLSIVETLYLSTECLAYAAIPKGQICLLQLRCSWQLDFPRFCEYSTIMTNNGQHNLDFLRLLSCIDRLWVLFVLIERLIALSVCLSSIHLSSIRDKEVPELAGFIDLSITICRIFMILLTLEKVL